MAGHGKLGKPKPGGSVTQTRPSFTTGHRGGIRGPPLRREPRTADEKFMAASLGRRLRPCPTERSSLRLLPYGTTSLPTHGMTEPPQEEPGSELSTIHRPTTARARASVRTAKRTPAVVRGPAGRSRPASRWRAGPPASTAAASRRPPVPAGDPVEGQPWAAGDEPLLRHAPGRRGCRNQGRRRRSYVSRSRAGARSRRRPSWTTACEAGGPIDVAAKSSVSKQSGAASGSGDRP